jgi:hypothetical protein
MTDTTQDSLIYLPFLPVLSLQAGSPLSEKEQLLSLHDSSSNGELVMLDLREDSFSFQRDADGQEQ